MPICVIVVGVCWDSELFKKLWKRKNARVMIEEMFVDKITIANGVTIFYGVTVPMT